MSQPAGGDGGGGSSGNGNGSSIVGKPVQFVPNSSEIELPFYSALFASKLEHDKLNVSARQVLGLYEPRAVDPEDSCKLQVLGNALTSRQWVAPGVPVLAVVLY